MDYIIDTMLLSHEELWLFLFEGSLHDKTLAVGINPKFSLSYFGIAQKSYLFYSI